MHRDSRSAASGAETSSFEGDWRRRFQERARKFDDDAAIAGWSRTGLDGRFRRFRELWQSPETAETWLDAGCGAGTYTRFLHVQGVHVVGLDYSVPSLARAHSRAPDGIGWCAGDIRQLPVRRQSLDGILCFGVMQSLRDPAPALNEMIKSLRPGGAIWVDGLNQWCLPSLARNAVRRLAGKPRHLRYDAPRDLRRHMERAGACGVHLEWIPLVPERLRVLRPLLESRAARRLFVLVPPLAAMLSHSFLLRGKRRSGVVDEA